MKRKTVKIIFKGKNLPIYSTPGSSGADVCCIDGFVLSPHERKMVHTGIFMQLPKDMECQVRPRSGLALKHGITCLNSPGTIDSDYQGECNVILINHSSVSYEFSAGERIAQFVFTNNIVQAKFKEITSFSKKTKRGEGGFGSTGK